VPEHDSSSLRRVTPNSPSPAETSPADPRSLPALHEVDVQALDAARLEPLIGRDRMAQFEAIAEDTQEMLSGRSVINANSTAVGGGVAEMLTTLVAYSRGAGVDARWLVISGDPEFFAITKRIHNGLYGGPGDGGELGEPERAHYEHVTRINERDLVAVVRPDDVVVVHDHQPAGLVAAIKRTGARVVWRCHTGRDHPNEWTERAWAFIRRYVEDADGFIFSRRQFAPPWMPDAKIHVIPPSIEPFSPKNEPMSRRNVRVVSTYVGLLAGDAGTPPVPFIRRDGSRGHVRRQVDLLETGPPPPPDAPLVTQVSRWDRVKDMAGVMRGFAEHVDPGLGAHLLLLGSAVDGVADDPEAARVLHECMEGWRTLPHGLRSRIHLACAPMEDPDENAAIVNAIQRHSAVVVQKSLAEGFGLTVTEAMWKARPVVASAVGGIADQIVDGQHGLLVDDPHDLESFGRAVTELLRDPARAEQLGERARARVGELFLADRHLTQYAQLLRAVG
jgi:trehalose synthase